MRVCELMVGDLVLHDGKVIRVDAVHKRKIGYHQAKDKLTWLFYGQFEPIPLTPEILEKNGFKMEFYSDYKVYELNNFKVCKSYCDYFEICDLWKDSDFGWEIISFCPCIYVHQLQHALKLCGIDKEIVV